MLGRSLRQALRRYLTDTNRTLNLVTDGRLVQSDEQHLSDGSINVTLSLDGQGQGRGAPVVLRGPGGLSIQPIQTVNLGTDDQSLVDVVSYSYWLRVEMVRTPRELLTFQWTPAAPAPQRRYPHLHIGSLVTSGSPFRGGDFNKLHIPTGVLSLEAVLLFAVEELGVEPAQGRDREAVLELLREGDRRFREREA